MTPLEPNACHRNRSVRCDGPATHRHFAFESEVLGGVETYVLDIWACDEHFKWFGLKATDEPVTAFLSDEEAERFRSGYNGYDAMPATRLADGAHVWAASPSLPPQEVTVRVENGRHYLYERGTIRCLAYGDHPLIAVGDQEAVTAAYVRHLTGVLERRLSQARKLAVKLAPYQTAGRLLHHIEQAIKKVGK